MQWVILNPFQVLLPGRSCDILTKISVDAYDPSEVCVAIIPEQSCNSLTVGR